MKRFGSAIAIALALFLFSGRASAITWFPQDFDCPIDNQKNTFMVVGSYGSYIYGYPSKYQWLFFPNTDSETFYLCKKCHLATFMWDFDKLPKDKLVEIQKVLAGVAAPKAFKDYTAVPITERLEIMEKVYSVLNKDELWWENFYRIKGYHYGKEGRAEKASEARTRSLAIIKKELASDRSKMPKKLLLYVSGAMKHFLNDDKGALEDFDRAVATKYADAAAKADEVKEAEIGLNERLKDYIARVKAKDKSPRSLDASQKDDH
jgi:hypothetical protein